MRNKGHRRGRPYGARGAMTVNRVHKINAMQNKAYFNY